MRKSDRPTILYVDDEPINLELFELNYEWDFITVTALSGPAGLKFIEERQEICFVVSDMKMPQMNGLEFIKKIKEKRPELPCMVLSGYEKTSEINKAIENNVIKGYFMKPFDHDELRVFIMNFIKNENI